MMVTERGKSDAGLKRQLDDYISKWRDLEDRSEKLFFEIKRGASEIKLIASKYTELEREKFKIENEFSVLKKGNDELEKRVVAKTGRSNVVDLDDEEEDMVTHLMIENTVLECEKKQAENEAEILKSKCRELGTRILELQMENAALREGRYLHDHTSFSVGLDVKTSSEHLQHEKAPLKGIGDSLQAGTPPIDMLNDQYTQYEDQKRAFTLEAAKLHGSTRVRKQLKFGDEGISNKKMAPSTPEIVRPYLHCVADINDREDEDDKKTNVHTSNFSSNSIRKRKRASNRISTDSEDDDDEIPISQHLRKHFQGKLLHDKVDLSSKENVKESSTPRRGLVSLRECAKAHTKNSLDEDDVDDDDNTPISQRLHKLVERKLIYDEVDLDQNVKESSTPRRRLVSLRECAKIAHKKRESGEDDDVDEDEPSSSTEGDSLGGFIVSDGDVSESVHCSSVSEDLSEDISDDDDDFDEVISKIRRKKEDKKVKWEFEADMLADFGKDIELCMKAICALYRQQTDEEKYVKETIFQNYRGFSQCDAPRGTNIAEFLCYGKEDVCKTVEQLREYNPKGPELCRTLATHYSKQLFAIYKNKEDPFFLPS